MRLYLAAAPYLLLAATDAVAADMLPLAQGIYVRAGTPCEGASNADTLSYSGGDNGINDQQTSCKINGVKKDGSTFSLKRTCASVRFGGSFDDQVKVKVFDRTSFKIYGRVSLGTQTQTFRFCGPKVQF